MKEARKKIKKLNRFFMALTLLAFGFAVERMVSISLLKKYVSPVKEAQADTVDDPNIGDPNGGACSNGSGGDW